MTIDIFTNRIPWGLLTPQEQNLFRDHEKSGGEFVFKSARIAHKISSICDLYYWDVPKAIPLPPKSIYEDYLKMKKMAYIAGYVNGNRDKKCKFPDRSDFDPIW